jgi:hypothetical protein
MNGYASRGWSAVFDSSWVEEVVAKGQSTAKEIEDLLEVCPYLKLVRRPLTLSACPRCRNRMSCGHSKFQLTYLPAESVLQLPSFRKY